MERLYNKIEQIESYIERIIEVIKDYNPDTLCTSPKKLRIVADEMREIIIDHSAEVEVNYMRDIPITDSEFYIAIQIPTVLQTSIQLEVETNSRASITISGQGTNIYDNGLSGSRKLTIPITNTKVNCEGWSPSNVVIRSNSNFTKCNIKNQNAIMIKGNMQGIEDLSYAFMGNENLRVIELHNIESTNNQGMFSGCSNLMNAVLAFKEGIQYDTTEMFKDCKNLRQLNLDFSNITSAFNIFSGCSKLEKITVPKDSMIPPNLDLSDTAIQTKELIELINNLKSIEEKQVLYVNSTLYNSFSKTQRDSFKNKGYILSTK